MTRLAAHVLRKDGHDVTTVADGMSALKWVQAQPFDLVISDLRMPLLDGMGLLARIREFDSEIPVLLLTAHSSVQTAVQAMKHGAWDYLEKPFDHAQIRKIVETILERQSVVLREQAAALSDTRPSYQGMVGRSRSMQMLFQMIERVARYNTPVLVIGESGTGKELIARAIHGASDRASGPFVAINCAGVVDSLFESQFFGHERGSFTGAQSAARGWMSAAAGGVLFLDEIGEMPLTQQAKLLRVLETYEVTPVGSTRAVKVDFRIVAATNRDLRDAIAQKQFREDLYYRLRGVELRVPPLAERPEDVMGLAESFLERANAEFGRKLRFDLDATRLLEGWHWPGNVRELRQVVSSAAMLADGAFIRPRDLQIEPLRPAAPAPRAASSAPVSPVTPPAQIAPDVGPLAIDEVEREHLDRVLVLANDNRSKAAAMLGISRHALYRMMQRHGRS